MIGGNFDEEFEFYTQLFFEKVKQGSFKIILSDILQTELIGAPENVIGFYNAIPQTQIEYVSQTESSISLAEEYINERVVGKSSLTDGISRWQR